MKNKALKRYWSLFCVVLAMFIAMVGVYIAVPNTNSADDVTPSTECRIVIEQGENYEAECYIATVKTGADATFNLTFEEGYVFDGCDYENYELLVGENSHTLTLKGVRYPTSVEIYTKKSAISFVEPDIADIPEDAAAVIYYLNGGSIQEKNDATYYSVLYSIGLYPRVNTDRAFETVKREGYVLKGWNTEPDGSGTHIGLGSRHTVVIGGVVKLYAEWSKCALESKFEYSLINTQDAPFLYSDAEDKKTLTQLVLESATEDRSAVITQYNGAVESEVAIPEFLDGYPVIGIMENAFYQHEEIRTLVLNGKLDFVQDMAFNECVNLKEVYLFDNIERLGDSYPFGMECALETMHINAAELPIYSSLEITQIANKMEMLINDRSGKPKLVFFGGCSLLYGLNTKTIYETLEEEYAVWNMGVIGGTCATFQMDLIYEYLTENDIFVHAPELGMMYQLLGDTNFDSRVYTNLENNYDLLSLLNLKNYGNVFQPFNEYLRAKQISFDSGGVNPSKTDYVEKIDGINEYGDLITQREGGFDNEGIAYIFEDVTNFEQSNAAEVMQEYYGKFAAKGLAVYYIFTPINIAGLKGGAGEELVTAILNTFETYEIPITPLMKNLNEVKYNASYFYDQNYHLSTDGAKRYTNLVIKYIKELLNKE